MYKLINSLILNRNFSTGKNFIRNTSLPICSNCLHFIEHTNNYPYDPKPSNEQYGRCKKFGEMNFITGAIEYDLAINCRLNVSKCGNYGSEYTEKIKT
jgi:hypothetical protein